MSDYVIIYLKNRQKILLADQLKYLIYDDHLYCNVDSIIHDGSYNMFSINILNGIIEFDLNKYNK